METENGRFRGAVGGFNRRDVAQYIEKTAGEHREKLETLQGQLEQTQQEKQALERELEEMTSREEQARARLEESAQSLTALQGELHTAQDRLAAAKQELDELRSKVGKLEPLARQYELLKDRVATVELDAHRKAQEVISEAQAQAACIRQDSAAWVEGLSDSYLALREKLSAFILRAEETGRDFEDGEAEYQALLRRAKEEQP